MKRLNFFVGLLCFISATVQTSFATEPPRATDVCVRNFHPEGSAGMNPCEGDVSLFQNVISAENEEILICTKVYETRLCEVSPREYRYVETKTQGVICTVNFHQEGVAEYCYSNPKIFSWAKGSI